MKNINAQESQNNFDGDPRDSSDMTLINFLKQNKPIAPPPAPNFEQQLFAEISKYPQKNLTQASNKAQNQNSKLWKSFLFAIPVAIAAGFAFNWINSRSEMRIALPPDQSQISSMSDADKAAIEQSLISSWNVSDDAVYQATSQSSGQSTTNSESQILIELTPIEYE